MKPCLKWVGGKTQILEKLFEKFPDEINDYYEPFVGGGSVMIELIHRLETGQIKVKGKIFINDKNSDLINLYNLVKTNLPYLIKKLAKLEKIYNDSPDIKYESRHKIELDKDIKKNMAKGKVYLYYHYRREFNTTKVSKLKSALLIFLNRTCFRGVYRIGPNGFNVPFGNYENPTILHADNLTVLHDMFNKYKIEFTDNDFTDFLDKDLQSDDFVYLDPPYYPLKKESFTTYQKDGFETKHDDLVNVCHNLHNKGFKFLHSNSWCDFTVNKYNQFTQDKILCKRRINSKNPKDTDYEILIYN